MVVLTAKTLIGLLRGAGYAVSPQALGESASYTRRSVYRVLSSEPPPGWILQALAKWREDLGRPLQPQEIEDIFQRYLREVWPIVFPPCPVPAAKPGRPPKGRCRQCGAPVSERELKAGACDECERDPNQEPPKPPAPGGGGGGGPEENKEEAADFQPVQVDALAAMAPAAEAEQKRETNGNQGTSTPVNQGSTRDGTPAASPEPGARAAARSADGSGVLSRTGQSESLEEFARRVDEADMSNPKTKEATCLALWETINESRSDVRKNRRYLCGRIAKTQGWGYGKTQDWMARGFREASGVAVRPNRIGMKEDTAIRYEQTAHAIGPELFKFLRDYGSATNGGVFAKPGGRSDILPVIMADPEMQEKLKDVWGGKVPALSTVEGILRKVFGTASRAEDAERRLIIQTIGFEATYAGEVVAVDAFGLPCNIQNGWGERGQERPSGERYYKRWVYLMVDLESGRVWLHSMGGKSEGDSWPAALGGFFSSLSFGPRACVCDQMAKLFDGLRHMKPGKQAPVHREVIHFMAAGTIGYAHAGKRPTGKGFIESAVRVVRASWRALDTQRTKERIRLHKAGQCFPREALNAAWYENEADFQAMLHELEAAVNARLLQRAERPREELWKGHAESVSWRAQRALVPNAAELLPEIYARHRVLVARGRFLTGTLDGKQVTLELDKESPLAVKPDEWPALVVPKGVCVGDDPESVHVYILEKSHGPVAKLHAAEAHAGRNFFGRVEGVKPKFGEERKSMPWSAEDRARFERDKAAKEYTKRLREGTTGEEIPDTPLAPEDCFRSEFAEE